MKITVRVLCVVVCVSIVVVGQYIPASPCPELFSYRNDDGQQVHGAIRYQPTGDSSSVNIIANFTIRAILPSNYVGRLEVLGDKQTVLKNFLRGEPLYYRVHFPITSPLPKVAAITVNNDIKCLGQSEFAAPGEALTTISLNHMLYADPSNVGSFPISRPVSGATGSDRRPSKPSNTISFTDGGNTFSINTDNFNLDRDDPSFTINTITIPNRNQNQNNQFEQYFPLNNTAPVEQNLQFQPRPQVITSIPYTPPSMPQQGSFIPQQRPSTQHQGSFQPQQDQFIPQQRPSIISQIPQQNPPQQIPSITPQIPQQNPPQQIPSITPEIPQQNPPQQIPSITPQMPQQNPPQQRPSITPQIPQQNPPQQRPSITPQIPQQNPAAPAPPPSSTVSNECGVVSGGPVALVYYGTSVKREEWPWLAAIFKKHDAGYICAGSLISNKHVVTAAHCMHDKTSLIGMNEFVVRAGAFDLDSWTDAVFRGLQAAKIHESYNPHTLANDILLLTLDSPVDYTIYNRPICLWEGDTNAAFIAGNKGVVVSWGQSETRSGGKGEPRKATLPIVTNEVCRASRIEFHKLTSENTLCAGDRNGTGPCNGDSGGGLFMFWGGRWRLRGIVSVSLRPITGEARCNLDEYVVFTDVAQYLQWITNNMIG